VGRKVDEFIKKLTILLPILSNNNHHAAFFHHMIDIEYHLLMERNKPKLKSHNYISHPIPLTDDRIRFLPMFTKINSSVYEKEWEDCYSTVTGAGNYLTYIEIKKDYYSKKESWVVKKILSLSSEFVNELNKLEKDTGIPLSSLYNIYSLIIAIDDSDFGNKSPDRSFDPKKKLIAIKELLSPFIKIPLPANVVRDNRDDFLCSVWGKIYNLLVECYWVLIIVGMTDLLNIIDSYRYDGLEEAKLYLLHSVVYLELEDRVEKIETEDDLLSFLNQEFCLFNLLREEFTLLIPPINVKKFYDKSNNTINYYIRSRSNYQDVNGDKDEDEEESTSDDNELNSEPGVINTIEGVIKHSNEIYTDKDESVSESNKEEVNEYLKTQHEDEETNDDAETENEIDKMSGNQELKQNKQPKEPPFLSEITIIKKLQTKMQHYGLMKDFRLNYKSKFNPNNVVYYICEAIFNILKTVKKQNFSYEMQQSLGISLSTLRRWEKEKKISENPSLSEINIIKDDTIQRQKHKVEKYYTQNQLIKEIQTSPRFIKYFQSQNKSTHAYSRTALRNKINWLIKNSRIKCELINGANQFKVSDIKNILAELAKNSK